MDRMFVSFKIHMPIWMQWWEMVPLEGNWVMRASHKWTNALMQETPQSFLAFSTMWGYSRKKAVCEPGNGPSPVMKSAGTLILDFPVFSIVRNKCSLWYFFIAAQTKTPEVYIFNRKNHEILISRLSDVAGHWETLVRKSLSGCDGGGFPTVCWKQILSQPSPWKSLSHSLDTPVCVCHNASENFNSFLIPW